MLASGACLPFPDITLLNRDLQGKRLPGAKFVITPRDCAVIAELSRWPDIEPSPIFGFVAALRSLGVTLDEMCRLCDFELAAGPMLGECTLRIEKSLQLDRPYRTEVLIHGIERKQSALRGTIDVLRFSVALCCSSAGRVAEVDLTWLLPRGSA
jgi:hypothetical protein